MFGPGRNIKAYIESMMKLDAMSNRFDIVYPSHGPIPVNSHILGGLIIGAKRILNREIEGMKAEHTNISAKLFDVGIAKFLYE